MASSSSKKRSVAWDHFDLIAPNKVRCLMCPRELAYHDNTSSMMRHLRSIHHVGTPEIAPQTVAPSAVSRQQKLDAALVDMVVKDAQPFSIVEDKGFKAFVNLLDPTYIIPSRKALGKMVEDKYKASKEKDIALVSKASAVSLTADMWTSMNMDAYLAVTGHFITEEMELSTVVLGVQKFPQAHTAAHLAEAKDLLMEEWGIKGKVTALVTDCAANMVACANALHLRHIMCFAHVLNLVVRRSLSQTPELEEIRSRGRRIVGHFKSSTTAKEKLAEIQRQMARPEHKLIQEADPGVCRCNAGRPSHTATATARVTSYGRPIKSSRRWSVGPSGQPCGC
ncbi:uncharacterized protein V6R79_007000 [Siganus canaliculatus]